MDTPICKEDEELEDGECSDQDDDIGMITANSHDLKDNNAVKTDGFNRQGCIPQIIINSDQSDDDSDSDRYDDDEDDYPSHGKKSRKLMEQGRGPDTASTFVNPLSSPGVQNSLKQGSGTRRKNNVWGAVLTEQMLSQDIKHFGVNASAIDSYRDVESYDYTIAKDDDREEIEVQSDSNNDKEDIFAEVVDLEKEAKKHQNRKRKRNLKERLGERNIKNRLGQRQIKEEATVGGLSVKEDDDVATVSQSIIAALREQNEVLFTRIVEAVGNKKALELFDKTVEVEKSGGMMINNGCRRRTPGGVYIQLMKNDSSIPEDVVSGVFEEENKKFLERKKEIRKIKKAARKKWKRKNRKMNVDLDRPETPTPSEELETLDNGNEGEVEATDLPDRPDTPEPKDSSDNQSEEEEEEEDDIAVAIAKAKAAILRKQTEMSEKKDTVESNQEVDMT